MPYTAVILISSLSLVLSLACDGGDASHTPTPSMAEEADSLVEGRTLTSTQECMENLSVEFDAGRRSAPEGTTTGDLALWFFVLLSFECLTDEQIRPAYAHLDDQGFECVRKSYQLSLRVFREFGVVMFYGIPDGLGSEARAVIESYVKAFNADCPETTPAPIPTRVTPTPLTSLSISPL